MKVISKIKVDLTRPNIGASVCAIQGDGNTRQVEISLCSGMQSWEVPAGASVAVAYCTPRGKRGLFDKLADGTDAITLSGSTVTVTMPQQMLAEAGTITASVVFSDAELNQLTAFPFEVRVAKNPAAGAQQSEDYIRLQWLEDKLDEYVKKITEGLTPGGAVSSVNGKTGAVTLTAQDVHALPDTMQIPFVPTKVSAFENDAGYLTEHQDISGKVDKVDGKGLSTHDYDNAAKAKVDAIPEDPKYTDTVYDDTEVKRDLDQLKDDLSDLAPAGAAVGQLFRVAAVGEDGKYTMEPVDMPSGDGMRTIADITLDENVSQCVFSADADGNALVLREVIVYADLIKTVTNCYTRLRISDGINDAELNLGRHNGSESILYRIFITDDGTIFSTIQNSENRFLYDIKNTSLSCITNITVLVNGATVAVMETGSKIVIIGR